MRGRCPAARSLSTTWDPMNPAPPVTRTFIAAPPSSLRRSSLRLRRAYGAHRWASVEPTALIAAPPSSLRRSPLVGAVVDRHAPVVLGDPVRVRQVDPVAHDAVARLVVDLPRRALDRLEDDVLVVPGGHSLRQAESCGVVRVEVGSCGFVLPRDDLVQPVHLNDPDGRCELVQPEVQAVD